MLVWDKVTAAHVKEWSLARAKLGTYTRYMGKSTNNAWIKPLYKNLAPVIREVFAMSFFVNILAFGVPIFTLQVYDRVVQNAAISTLWGLAIGLVIVLVFDYILRQARSRIMQTVALRVDVEVGRAVFDKFTSLPLNILESRGGNYWQSLFRDVDTVRNTLSGAPAILICDLPFAIMFFIVIYFVAQPIVWVLMIVMVLFLFVTWRAGAATGKASSTERNSAQDRDSLIAEMIQGRTTIKALALEGAMRPMWEERHAANIANAITRGGRTDAYTNLGQTLTQSTSLMMTSFGALAIIGQDLTMGSLIATNMMSGRLLGPLNQLVSQWRTYSGYSQAVDRLGEIFDIESERMESEVKLDKPKGRLEAVNLTFAYAEGLPPVCDNISVSFDAGGIHALVGRNGSGKTTLLKMLQGLYRPSNGRVLLDGADINQFSRAELARWMGYVPQESTLFAGTVRDNITNRYPDATDEEIIKASKAAGVHEFIIDLPDGYGSDIGEAGQRLSGGQRQRIAIARALIGEPAALMLDEPSSSLDRHAEQELRTTLKELSKTHTVIIVTHSPILLAACDNLIALDKGKIALAGGRPGIFYRVCSVAQRRSHKRSHRNYRDRHLHCCRPCQHPLLGETLLRPRPHLLLPRRRYRRRHRSRLPRQRRHCRVPQHWGVRYRQSLRLLLQPRPSRPQSSRLRPNRLRPPGKPSFRSLARNLRPNLA